MQFRFSRSNRQITNLAKPADNHRPF